MSGGRLFSADRNGVKKRKHKVRSNPVSEGSKDLLTPTSCHVYQQEYFIMQDLLKAKDTVSRKNGMLVGISKA